jgi:uncharacterized protein DUF5666
MELNLMNPKHTLTKIALCFVLCATLVLAHGGLEHVMGTIAKVSDGSVTVTTTAGKTVEVLLDAKTTFARGSQAIQKADLKVGDRVVIHAEKSGDKLIAHTVEIGTGAKTASRY